MTVILAQWRWWLIGGLALTIVLQHGRIQHLKLDIAEEALSVVEERAWRQEAARQHERKLAMREQTHVRAQQTKDETYAKDKERLQRSVAAERATADGLRKQLRTATSRSGTGSETDPVACGRAFARLETLGQLAGESFELLAEGRGLLEQCRLDVQRLWGQIEIDRVACNQTP